MLGYREQSSKCNSFFGAGKQNKSNVSNNVQIHSKRLKANSKQQLKPSKIVPKQTDQEKQYTKPFHQLIKKQENQFIKKEYGHEIFSNLSKYNSKHKNCLSRHNISKNMRAKMVDWMIEVISSYKFSQQCFFYSVRLMDQYFMHSPQVMQTSNLHLIGVTSMFTACKYQQIYPMKMKVIYQKVAHEKLTKKDILKTEQQILKCLNFNLVKISQLDYALYCLNDLKLAQKFSEKTFLYLQKICIYLAKMITFDIDLYQNYRFNELAGALIYVAFKIIQQFQKVFKAEKMIKPLAKSLNIRESTMVQSAAKVLSLAKSFQKTYPNLKNLKKFNGFSLDPQQKLLSTYSSK